MKSVLKCTEEETRSVDLQHNSSHVIISVSQWRPLTVCKSVTTAFIAAAELNGENAGLKVGGLIYCL